MRGVLFNNQNIRLEQFEDPEPGPDEVVVQMKASAICRSDMHFYHCAGVVGGIAPETPIIPGHEPCGVVDRVGADVTSLQPGDRVAVYLAIGCMHCPQCLAGYLMLCVNKPKFVGVDVHGGDADLLKVPAVNCMLLPDGMSFVEGALSTDTAGGLYDTLKRMDVAGQTVAIFGIGPMGASGALVAKAMGARVVAVDVNPARLELIKSLGADEVINPTDEDPVAKLRELTDGRGVDAGLDCSGNAAAQNNMLDAAAAHGRVAFIGEAKATTIKPSDQFIRKRLTAIGGWYFPLYEWEEIARFIVEHKLPLEQLATHRFPLEAAREAFELFDQGKTEKVVFVW